ncbi:hypothetical protein [Streptomyces sulphureus]|uniref:hypothetical protein n=1 Tax=Streptomyces sulphureus TaxID=47758 RepID=UPI000370A38B|nr:hypothetical protein [Streptomyces sulphureus]
MSTDTALAGAKAPAAGRRSTKSAPTGADRIPRRSQGWYRDPLDSKVKLRSVTTILSQGMPKEALVFWAGNLTAETALDNLPYLVRASLRPEDRAEAYDWLRRAHTRKKDARAAVGSAVHQLIEAHVLGQPVPDELRDDEEVRPYVAHFERFVSDWDVTFEASEMVVANYTRGYAGTLDYYLRSPLIAAELGTYADTVFMGDTKTGGELDKKGVYPEAGLQMAAYAHAEVGWLRDGSKVPLPTVYHTGIVLHLRPEGYRPVPVACGAAEFAAFCHARDIAEFQRTTAKGVVGEALTLPTTSEERAA